MSETRGGKTAGDINRELGVGAPPEQARPPLEVALENAGRLVEDSLAALVSLGLRDDVTWECASGSFTLRPRKPVTAKIVRRGGSKV